MKFLRLFENWEPDYDSKEALYFLDDVYAYTLENYGFTVVQPEYSLIGSETKRLYCLLDGSEKGELPRLAIIVGLLSFESKIIQPLIDELQDIFDKIVKPRYPRAKIRINRTDLIYIVIISPFGY